jgi:hypothetical protein
LSTSAYAAGAARSLFSSLTNSDSFALSTIAAVALGGGEAELLDASAGVTDVDAVAAGDTLVVLGSDVDESACGAATPAPDAPRCNSGLESDVLADGTLASVDGVLLLDGATAGAIRCNTGDATTPALDDSNAAAIDATDARGPDDDNDSDARDVDVRGEIADADTRVAGGSPRGDVVRGGGGDGDVRAVATDGDPARGDRSNARCGERLGDTAGVSITSSDAIGDPSPALNVTTQPQHTHTHSLMHEVACWQQFATDPWRSTPSNRALSHHSRSSP